MQSLYRSLSGTAHSKMRWCLCELGWFLFFHPLFLPPANYSDHFIDNFLGLDALCGSCCLKYRSAKRHLIIGNRMRSIHKQNLFGCKKLARLLAGSSMVIVHFVALI